MTLENIKREMGNIENNNSLTEQEKNVKVSFYKKYLEFEGIEDRIQKLLQDFIENANRLTTMSNGSFQLQSNLEFTRNALKGNVFSSEMYNYLSNKGIEDYTLEQFSNEYLCEYERETNTKQDETRLALDLFKKTLLIERVKEKKIEIIKRTLGEILGNELVSKDKEDNTLRPNENAVVRLVPKTREELNDDYVKVMVEIDQLYLNQGLLSLNGKVACERLAKELFEYYNNPEIKINNDVMLNQDSKRNM